MNGTELFHRAIDLSMYDGDQERADLMREVWTPTPWVTDVYTGGLSHEFRREMEIREWCEERFGQEAFVIGGRLGSWQRGSVTINGWSWMGFATEAMMSEFLSAWGENP